MEFTSHLDVQLTEATEHSARVRVASAAPLDGLPSFISDLSGTVHGPRCAYARTLPTSFRLAAESASTGRQVAVTAMIPEPCYWSSELPFVYDVKLEVRLASGELHTWSHWLGLRRLEIHGRDLRVERRRSVLRGTVCNEISDGQLHAARDANAALIVRRPSRPALQRADEIGVKLIVDLRYADASRAAAMNEFSWRPSVHAVLADRIDEQSNRARAVLICQVVEVDNGGPEQIKGADLVAIELEPGERPPPWMAAVDKPVIAIRRGSAYADILEARAACDRLQAELAPEFDLAGYFVAQ